MGQPCFAVGGRDPVARYAVAVAFGQSLVDNCAALRGAVIANQTTLSALVGDIDLMQFRSAERLESVFADLRRQLLDHGALPGGGGQGGCGQGGADHKGQNAAGGDVCKFGHVVVPFGFDCDDLKMQTLSSCCKTQVLHRLVRWRVITLALSST